MPELRFRAGRLIAVVAVVAMAMLTAACSAGGDYPTVLAPPAARYDQPMTPDQVKQATNSLISDRTQLSAEAQAAQASAVASGMALPPATTGTTPGAGAATK